jgi:hypothetical protein
MEKFKRVLFYILINSAFLASLYFGLEKGIQGAEYLFWFMFWVIVVASFIGFASKEAQQKIRDRGPSVPRFIDIHIDILVLGYIVWNHHWIAGIFFLLSSIFTCIVYEKSNDDK